MPILYESPRQARKRVKLFPPHGRPFLYPAIDLGGGVAALGFHKLKQFKAIAALKKIGIKESIMLTGDARNVAQSIGKELGLSRICSELLPADKVKQVEMVLADKAKNRSQGKVAFVGDGINDAPVLSRADIG